MRVSHETGNEPNFPCAHVNKLHQPKNNPEKPDKVREFVKSIVSVDLGATANNSRLLERDMEHFHTLRKYLSPQRKYFAHTQKLLWWNTVCGMQYK